MILLTVDLLQFRPVGAIIFGLASDRFGRKWPLIVDLCCCGALSIGTAFVKTFPQFLAVRCLFGIAMGGASSFVRFICVLVLMFSACRDLGPLGRPRAREHARTRSRPFLGSPSAGLRRRVRLVPASIFCALG